MAGEKYIDRAVTQLAARITAQLPTYLRNVETDQGLAVDSLTDPVGVGKARLPFDARSPFVEVFDERWDYESFSNRIMVVDCTVAIHYVGDADIEATEIFMRRYMTALLRMIEADATLGGTVEAAIPTDGQSAVARGPDSATHYVYAQGVEVRLHQP